MVRLKHYCKKVCIWLVLVIWKQRIALGLCSNSCVWPSRLAQWQKHRNVTGIALTLTDFRSRLTTLKWNERGGSQGPLSNVALPGFSEMLIHGQGDTLLLVSTTVFLYLITVSISRSSQNSTAGRHFGTLVTIKCTVIWRFRALSGEG